MERRHGSSVEALRELVEDVSYPVHPAANIASKSRVAINLNSDEWGNSIAVVTGTASVDSDATRANEISAYLEKYREGIAQIEMTPDSMAKA